MKQTRMRIFPDGCASLVTVSAALVRTCVIVALSDDAFVPFQTARNSQQGFDTITCVGVTTGTTLPIRLTMIHKTSKQTCYGNVPLVNWSGPFVRAFVVVAVIEYAFVPYQTASKIRKGSHTLICVSNTTSIALQI